MKTIIIIISAILFMSCQEKNEQQTASQKLCGYVDKERESSQSNSCLTNELITELNDVSGIVIYDNTLKKYLISTSVDASYDCQFVGIPCDDFQGVIGDQIVYSAKVYPYHGSYKTPVGGQLVFSLGNLRIR